MSGNQSPISHPHLLFIDGSWTTPSSDLMFGVIDPNDEREYYRVAGADGTDMVAAVAAARRSFDDGPWPRLSHEERAATLSAMAKDLRGRADLIGELWAREAGAIRAMSAGAAADGASILESYVDLATEFAWVEDHGLLPDGGYATLVREPVGVVAAIIPWNAPLREALLKVAPALLAGCTVILKAAPEAPGAAYVLAEVAEAVGLPRGVLNVVTADREVSELLVRDPRVDKVSFTGSTAAGRAIGAIMAQRMGRLTLELGGKSAAVVLDDADLGQVANALVRQECVMAGQVCASLTRVVVSKHRHDELADAIAAAFSAVRVGPALDPDSQMGPLVSALQRDRVAGHIRGGVESGAVLVSGGGRPRDLDRGYFIEPTVFAHVDNSTPLAQQEIFGPVLSVIPTSGEADSVRVANDSIYGLNASVFTPDRDRASAVARDLQSGSVGMNGFRSTSSIAFGGFKQSGIGREGGKEGLLSYLETKVVVLDGQPDS